MFRRVGAGFWEWFSGSVVEGILVGRCSPQSTSSTEPANFTAFTSHVTGWNSTYLDTANTPRVWELLINNTDRARLRIDQGASGFVGRLKVYSTVSGGSAGEDLEYDLDGINWDGTTLTFTQHMTDGSETNYQAQVSGRTITGTYAPGSGSFTGTRAEVLTHGLDPMTATALSQWSDRTRAQLMHLIMADDPQPLTHTMTPLASNLSPTPSVKYDPSRDDNPAAWPQAYTLTEVRFDYTLPNPYGGAPIARTSHGYLAIPNGNPPAGGKFPAVVAVNGHDGSGWEMMDPDSQLYWYGDSFARRGFIVLALDISHRPLADRSTLYTDYTSGDDPAHGNGTHPAVKATGFDSDWEEDGERSWDASRALDYLLTLPNVDPTRIVLTGISMGGEITAITGSLDTRFPIVVAAGYSPDLGVVLYHGNHPCWRWQHGDIREYVDSSDYFSLISPRALLIETGRQDFTYSDRNPPFSSDMQVFRRAMAAFNSADQDAFNLYLHYDQHRYHVGDINPTSSTPQGVLAPVLPLDAEPGELDWQTTVSTSVIQPTLYDWISDESESAPLLSSNTLDFGSQSVGTAGNPVELKISNTAAAALTFSSIQTSGDWSVVDPDDCQPSIAVGGSCTLDVAFTPTGEGSRVGTLTLADNAVNSPQTLSLTGVGLAAISALSPSGLSFPSLPNGTTSSTQSVTLSNTGNQALSITGIAFSGPNSGDFGESQNCGGTLAVGASCTVGVTFTPTGAGFRVATLTVTSNALNSPETLSLSGGDGPYATLSSTSLVLPPQAVGVANPPQNIQLTNGGNAALLISSVQVSTGFNVANACASSLAAGASCAIGVSLDATVVGPMNGTLTVNSNSPSSPQTVALSGAGMDFNLSASASSKSIAAGQSANYSVNIAPIGGLNYPVALACSGAPPLSTCTVTPNSVTLNGTSSASVTVAVSTTAGSLTLPGLKILPPRISGIGRTSWALLLLAMAACGLLATMAKRRAAIPLGLCLMLVLSWSACGGTTVAQKQKTPSGTYTIEVTGTTNLGTSTSKSTHVLNLTLTVN